MDSDESSKSRLLNMIEQYKITIESGLPLPVNAIDCMLDILERLKYPEELVKIF